MTRLVVVIGYGPVNAADIAMGLCNLADLTFVCIDAAHPLMQLFEEIGDVIIVEGDTDEVTRRLVASNPSGIVTFSDEVMVLTAEIAARLGLAFHSHQTATLLTDKALQRARLRDCGVDDVRSVSLRRAAELPPAIARLGLPAVLKPVHSSGSRNTYLITDAEQGGELAERLLGNGADYVLEEYLVGRPCAPFGDFVSVESIICADGIKHVAVTGKLPMAPPFRETAHFWPSALDEQEKEQVTALTGRALSALGMSLGVAQTEIKLTSDGPRVIEVNGRLGGFINDLCRSAFRINLVEIAGRLALGLPLPPIPDRMEGVHFQFHNITPTSTFSLRSISGVRELRKIAGVTGYRPVCGPGDNFEPSVMSRHFDAVFGIADDHAGMFEILEEVRDVLRYQIVFPSEEREFTSRQLLEYAQNEPASG